MPLRTDFHSLVLSTQERLNFYSNLKVETTALKTESFFLMRTQR